jgi:hypothetical protein
VTKELDDTIGLVSKLVTVSLVSLKFKLPPKVSGTGQLTPITWSLPDPQA